jgi:nicotinate dehydrogenase subunit B
MKRRTLLAGGGALVVAFSCRLSSAQEGGATPTADPALPGSLKVEPHLDGWIRIAADGGITVFTGKAELGQGIRTALLQVAADELVVAPGRITMIGPDTERTANEGYTAGSHSMQDSGTAIRHAAAQVRELLLARAAQRMSVAPETLTLADGVVASGDRTLTYASLVDDAAVLHIEAAPRSLLRDPKLHTWVGKPMPRTDIPAKVSGGASYVQDMRLPGMVHARIVRPPSAGSTLRQLDAGPIEAMPGVLRVVRDGRFLGVIATREYQAVLAQRALAAATHWEDGPATLPAAEDLHASLRRAPSQDYVIRNEGDPDTAGTTNVTADYQRPYQLHGSIGPSCAIAQQVDGKTTVWTHTQGVFPQRKGLAELLGVPLERVHCIHVEGSGCYGHNGADDVAADAVLLARALPGRPVRLQWMREDEHGAEPLGPPMSTRVQAALDANGMIKAWRYDVWSNTHNGRPGGAGEFIAGTCLAQPFTPMPPKPIPQPEGGGDRNAIPLYTLPNARVTHHFLPVMPLRVSALRSLGAYMNVFSIESFMDELAQAAGTDPVEFRRRHTSDPRALEVIRVAAERFGWNGWHRSPMRGHGFAFARYKNLAAYAAIACEVEVRRDTGELVIRRVVAAVDSGEAVNPDGIRNQMEGGIVQSASWTTVEEASFDRDRMTALDWGAYPILRFPQVPWSIEVHIVDRPGQPFLGTGEAAQGPAAAAIANAVADATGVRMRTLPLSRERVRTALGP